MTTSAAVSLHQTAAVGKCFKSTAVVHSDQLTNLCPRLVLARTTSYSNGHGSQEVLSRIRKPALGTFSVPSRTRDAVKNTRAWCDDRYLNAAQSCALSNERALCMEARVKYGVR